MTLGRSEEYPRPFALFSGEQKMALVAAVEFGVDFDLLTQISFPLHLYIPRSIARALAERGDKLGNAICVDGIWYTSEDLIIWTPIE